MLPTHIDEEEGKNAITSRAHPVPCAEEGRAHAPIGGLLYPYKKFPRISYIEVQEKSVSSMIVQHCNWKEGVGRESNIS